MKTSALTLLCFAASAAVSLAQVSSERSLRVLTPPTSAPHSPPPKYQLNAKWNDRLSMLLTVPVKNTNATRPLNILGISSTRGVFVTDYPASVASNEEATIAFLYQPAENSDGNLEVIRLLTDQGTKEIQVEIAREAIVQLETRELRWKAGDAGETKSVTLTVAANTVVPKGVRATGDNRAELEAVNATTWRIKVTPTSTAKSGQFAVMVEFDKSLPGVAAVILGVVQPRD